MNRAEIERILSEIDRTLAAKNQTMDLVLIGYSAILLAGGVERGTDDLDALETSDSRLLLQHGIHVLPEHYFHFHPQYQTRLHHLKGYRYLRPFYLDAHDLFLLKLDAGRPKDLQDIRDMIRSGLVDKTVMDALFREWKSRWYPAWNEIDRIYESLWEERDR